MLELIFSALITILPDYLFRRYKQGKRIGYEITLYSVWYELRWGITSCALLAITLLSVIFYYHPTTSNVTSLFRTVTILSDTGGRVDEVYVSNNQKVRAGDPIFRLDTTRQVAAAETASRRIAEIDAALIVGKPELEIAVRQYTEGTFLIDIIDVENAALIAEATARKRMRQDITGMDQATINNLVAGIMTELMP